MNGLHCSLLHIPHQNPAVPPGVIPKNLPTVFRYIPLDGNPAAVWMVLLPAVWTMAVMMMPVFRKHLMMLPWNGADPYGKRCSD